MDDRRFDELTRTLARPATRRRTVQLLAASLLGGTALRGTKPVAGRTQGQAVGGCPTQWSATANRVTGSCEDLAQRLRNPGIAFPDGNGGVSCRRDWAGATVPGWQWAPRWSADRANRRGRLCLTTTRITPNFSAEPKTYPIEWQPEQRLSCACRAEKARFERDLAAHEAHHRADAERIAGAANREWRHRPLTACSPEGTPPAERLAAAQREMDRVVNEALKRYATETLNDKYDKAGELYHNSPGGTITPPDCEKCSRPDCDPRKCERCDEETGECQACAEGRRCCEGACKRPEECCDGGRLPNADGTCQQKIFCRCNGTCYDSATACTNECRGGLGCFTDICRPAQPGEC